MLGGTAAAQRVMMIEFGHFISVIVKLARGVANDGYICCAVCALGISLHLFLTALLFGILHYERSH